MFLSNYIGELAALSTAVLWSASAMCTTSATRILGSLTFNKLRLLFWTITIFIIHFFVTSSLFPVADKHQTLLLIFSGISGLVIGDIFLYQSYIDIGPGLALLIANIGPFFTALIAAIGLHEHISIKIIFGMIITIAGAAWVVHEEHNKIERHPKLYRGILFAMISALGQATGYVIAKPALVGPAGVHPISATLIRLITGTILFWFIALFLKNKIKKEIVSHEKQRAFGFIALGSLLGPIGIWTSLISLKAISAAVASTLIATLPVTIIPFLIIFYKQKISFRAIFGAVITVIGVGLLFYFNSN